MTEKLPEYEWVETARARGMDHALRIMLDVVEPIGPLAAQFLWVMQPLARIFGAGQVAHDLATALEDPDGVADIREQLDK